MNSTTIPFDSPDAAKQVTVTLWKSSDGRMYNEENLARFAGCTHRTCKKCYELTEKSYILCANCRREKDTERWLAMPRKPWDGVQMVYSKTTDEYYESPDEASELNGGSSVEDLRLVLCDPEYASISSDHFCDITPEDGELPDEVHAAIKAFNEACEKHPCCWVEGKYAMEISDDKK